MQKPEQPKEEMSFKKEKNLQKLTKHNTRKIQHLGRVNQQTSSFCTPLVKELIRS
jgi:hypothetical protein